MEVSRSGVKEEFQFQKGVLWLTGECVNEATKHQKIEQMVPQEFLVNKQRRDGESSHITVITPVELKFLRNERNLDNAKIIEVIAKYGKDDWVDLGLGCVANANNKVFFKVILWNGGMDIRQNLGLSLPFDFHVTVGYDQGDIFDVEKGVESILFHHQITNSKEVESSVNYLLRCAKLMVSNGNLPKALILLNEVTLLWKNSSLKNTELECSIYMNRCIVFGKLRRMEECIEDAQHVIEIDPQNIFAYSKKGTAHYHLQQFEEAFRSFHEGLQVVSTTIQNNNSNNNNNNNNTKTESIEKEVDFLKKGIEKSRKGFNNHLATPRERRFVLVNLSPDSENNNKLVKLPRNFSWVVLGALAGTSLPKRNEQIIAFERFFDIKLIVTAMETPLPDNLFSKTTLNRLHLPVDNYKVPKSFEIVDYVLERTKEVIDTGHSVIFHCAGGKGRCGTLLCCYLLKYGFDTPKENIGCVMTPNQVLHDLREIRPGSVETAEQEEFIRNYFSYLWKTYNETSKLEAKSITEKKAIQTFEPKSEIPFSSERYPSTPHLPFSPCINVDDVTMSLGVLNLFTSVKVVITEKLDGGNCCFHGGNVYARTHSQPTSHPSFGVIKGIFGERNHIIESDEEIRDWQIFGENMTGIHSIEYDNLSSFFYLFAARDKFGNWKSWDDVERLASKLNLPTVPIRFKGVFKNGEEIKNWMDLQIVQTSSIGINAKPEGFVIRICDQFSNNDFEKCMGKFVRPNHIQTPSDWTRTWKRATIRQQIEKGESSTTSSASTTMEKFEKGEKKEKDVKGKKPVRKGDGLAKFIKMVMLVGIPASGKSTFGKKLATSGNGTKYVYICQDELGSRSNVEEAIAHTLLGKNKTKKVILDRCNVTPDDRKGWLKIAMIDPKEVIIVYFDVEKEECCGRVKGRIDHPTIPNGTGEKIVQSFAKQLVPPSKVEGFADVITVKTFEEVDNLLARFGVGPVNE